MSGTRTRLAGVVLAALTGGLPALSEAHPALLSAVDPAAQAPATTNAPAAGTDTGAGPAAAPPAHSGNSAPRRTVPAHAADTPPTDSPLKHSGLMRTDAHDKPLPPKGDTTSPVLKAPAGARHRTSPYHATTATAKANEVFEREWGIQRLHTTSTMSGNLIRFSFRVVEPKLAKALGDHEATPQLYSPRAHAMLQVPNMELVGQLRQLHTEAKGREYWMVFSNKGNLVRKGDRVNVIIGKFHADGLLVE